MSTILFVAYHFAPENTSGTHRSLHFARVLVDAGHDVHVIAGPMPPTHRADPALDRVFPWPHRVQRIEMPQSLGSVYMSWRNRARSRMVTGTGRNGGEQTPERRPAGRVGTIRHHVRVWDAFPDHQRAWFRPAFRTGVELGRSTGAAAVFASGPPWTGVVTGHRIAKALGVPFIADFRDPWSTGSGATWRYPTEWAQRRAERWEAGVLADAAAVCFNSGRLASLTASLNRLGSRAHVILNGSDLPRQASPAPLDPDRPLRIRHFGSLYAGRSIEALVRALDDLIEAGAIGRDEIELELIGDADLGGAGRDQFASTRLRIARTPHLPFTEAARRMAEASVLLVVQTEQHANLIPTKLYDYLCTGNPVLVMTPHDSATWDVASGFARCVRLDFESTERNRDVLARFVAAWRAGQLRQDAAVEDTTALRKEPLGVRFVELVERVVGPAEHVLGDALAR